MIKRYNIRAGVIFSLVIAVLSSFPRLIRFDSDQLSGILGQFAYLFCSVFFCWFMHQYFLVKATSGASRSVKLLKAIASIFTAAIFIAAINYAFNVVNIFPLPGSPREETGTYQLIAIRAFRTLIISSVTFFAAYYHQMMFRWQQSRLENEYLKQENLKAQLASLKEQISPHFLFNSLNTLSTISHDKAVKEYIVKLSDVYRYVLHYHMQPTVSVQDELQFIKSYTYIMESRFEHGLHINIRIDGGNLDKKILPLALQLLVENAIKHNVISYQDPLTIDIYDENDRLVVENGHRPKINMEKRSGLGLHNLAQRYKLSSGKEIGISQTDTRFKVAIPFL